MSPTRNL